MVYSLSKYDVRFQFHVTSHVETKFGSQCVYSQIWDQVPSLLQGLADIGHDPHFRFVPYSDSVDNAEREYRTLSQIHLFRQITAHPGLSSKTQNLLSPCYHLQES